MFAEETRRSPLLPADGVRATALHFQTTLVTLQW